MLFYVFSKVKRFFRDIQLVFFLAIHFYKYFLEKWSCPQDKRSLILPADVAIVNEYHIHPSSINAYAVMRGAGNYQ